MDEGGREIAISWDEAEEDGVGDGRAARLEAPPSEPPI